MRSPSAARARHSADAARLGADGGGGPRFRRAPASCSTAPSSVSPDNPSVLLARAVLHGRIARHTTRRSRCSTELAAPRPGRRSGPNELLEKGRLLDRMGRHDGGVRRLRRGQAACREAERPHLHGRGRRSDAGRAAASGFFTAGRLAILPRAAPPGGVAAADLHPRLPALRHDAGRADAVGASAHRAPATSCRSINEIDRRDAADAEQPARLSRGAGRAVDGRPAATGSTICATTICSARASSASSQPGAAWFTDKMPLNEIASRADRADVPARRR